MEQDTVQEQPIGQDDLKGRERLGDLANSIEIVGDFRIYYDGRVINGMSIAVISYKEQWLPGVFDTRDTALFACGFVHGGGEEKLLEIRDREGRKGHITMADFR